MASPVHLSEGKIRPHLIRLALPLLVGNILQQFYNLISAVIVERYLGETAFAAVGIAGTVMNLFIFVLGGCCTGIAVVMASLYGKRDFPALRQAIFLSLVFGASFTILISVLGLLGTPFLLRLIQTPENVSYLAVEYLNTIFLGLLACFLYNFFAAVLRAIGNTKSALLFLVISIAISLVLAVLFVAKMGLGVRGAALSAVLAQILSAVLCFIYIMRSLPFLRVHREDMHYDGALIGRISKFSLVSAMHQSSLYIGKLLVQGAVNTMGLAAISAYTATTRVEGIVLAVGDSGAESISVFVAQNTGAGKKQRAREGFLTGLRIMLLVVAVLSVCLFFLAEPLMHFFVSSDNAQTIAYGTSYLQILCFCYFLSYTGSAFVGYFRGSGRVDIPFIGTTIHVSVRVILSYLLVSQLGMDAVAYATGIGWIIVVVFHSVMFRRFGRMDKMLQTLDEEAAGAQAAAQETGAAAEEPNQPMTQVFPSADTGEENSKEE
ncbi:MATE family efflux transporter [Clostridium minihomine]|uniref:MATE family efflux transporter n=1 Tax=Clostridium minihomine TaxID=2045012 RepID=UPI000C792C91|nr:MATE family efflux transporter [Clostridium minihomine]